MRILQIPAFLDNYFFLIHEPVSRLTGVVDPGAAAPVVGALQAQGWKLDYIWNTHHHADHVGGNLELKRRYGCRVFGSAKDSARIPGFDQGFSPGEEFLFGEEAVRVLSADGHTRGHIVYWFPVAQVLFAGDTIFSLGCGKLFEGTPKEMWATLSQLRGLPPDTLIYCAHEYTEENAAFAIIVDPKNAALKERILAVKRLREKGLATVPSKLSVELATNPFLRPECREIQRRVGAVGKELWEIFAATRAAKDEFDSSASQK